MIKNFFKPTSVLITIMFALLGLNLNAQTSTDDSEKPHPLITGGLGLWAGININGGAQYFLNKRISIGGNIAYGKDALYDEYVWGETSYYNGFYTVYIPTMYGPYTPNVLLVAPRAEIHLLTDPSITETWDLYMAGILGIANRTYEVSSLNQSNVVIAGCLGARLYLDDHFGLFGEGSLGIGDGINFGTGLISAGLVYRF